jgi:cellobiose phosphorylase
VFEFTAPVPTPTPGAAADGISQDPWFILGNYGLTVFVHASGAYELLSGERGFAWLAKSAPSAEPVTRRFGCGFAEFTLNLPGGVLAKRTLATVPSRGYRDRVSAMLITVELENPGSQPVAVTYREALSAQYEFANLNNGPSGRDYARYTTRTTVRGQLATARFVPRELRPLVFADPDQRAQADAFPANVHVQVLDDTGRLVGTDAVWKLKLAPGERRTLQLAVGYSLPDAPWPRSVARLGGKEPSFRAQWRRRIPQFRDADPALGLEMQWHAAVLHAMATWDAFYEETFIPQGTVYEYRLGVAACTRDHAQHALPLCHYDTDLARSILRFFAKHTDVYGRIRHTDEGLGFIPRGGDEKSDSQIYTMLLLAEYLRVTGDRALLKQRVPFDGMIGMGTLGDRAALWFRYLRDGVHVGKRGLVRTMNADWNDGVHHLWFAGLRYHNVFGGESLLNTTMALQVCGELAAVLPKGVLRAALNDYRGGLLQAFLADWGDRPFVARAYAGNEAVGLDEMYFEPQPYVLALPEVPLARRRALWKEIKRRVWDGEKKGARQREVPGSRENGGFWFALNGPLAVNLRDVDRRAAEECLQRMTLTRHAQDYPDYWIGMWSAPDSFDSSCVSPAVSASDQDDFTAQGGLVPRYVQPFPVFCAHAHAWPLYVWFRLRE